MHRNIIVLETKSIAGIYVRERRDMVVSVFLKVRHDIDTGTGTKLAVQD